MEKKKILLFGGTGLVGTRITQLLNQKYIIQAPLRSEVDLISRVEVEGVLDKNRYDAIVYVAGVTSQNLAEQEKELAMKINYESIDWISKKANLLKLPVVYFSTDAVFPCEESNKPYTEFQKTNPLNYYGITKANGEEAVLSAGDNNLVIF